MGRKSERLRRLDDKFLPHRTPYKPPSPRESRLFVWLAIAGLATALIVLVVLPDHNQVRFGILLLSSIMIQPFVADRWERRFGRWR